MTLPIILGFLFGFLLGLVAVLLLTMRAICRENAKYKAICYDIDKLIRRDLELWKSFMEDTAQKKRSPEPESQRLWKQRWPYKENNHEPSQPTL